MKKVEELFEVEAIREAVVVWKRGKKISWKFLVKWHGYKEAENTWEPVTSFESAQEILGQFWDSVDLGGRDNRDGSQFKINESFVSLRSRIERVTKHEDEPQSSKRKRKATSSSTRKRDRSISAPQDDLVEFPRKKKRVLSSEGDDEILLKDNDSSAKPRPKKTRGRPTIEGLTGSVAEEGEKSPDVDEVSTDGDGVPQGKGKGRAETGRSRKGKDKDKAESVASSASAAISVSRLTKRPKRLLSPAGERTPKGKARQVSSAKANSSKARRSFGDDGDDEREEEEGEVSALLPSIRQTRSPGIPTPRASPVRSRRKKEPSPYVEDSEAEDKPAASKPVQKPKRRIVDPAEKFKKTPVVKYPLKQALKKRRPYVSDDEEVEVEAQAKTTQTDVVEKLPDSPVAGGSLFSEDDDGDDDVPLDQHPSLSPVVKTPTPPPANKSHVSVSPPLASSQTAVARSTSLVAETEATKSPDAFEQRSTLNNDGGGASNNTPSTHVVSSSQLPSHRARAANPLIKLVDKDFLKETTSAPEPTGAVGISVKARLFAQISRGATGPAPSSNTTQSAAGGSGNRPSTSTSESGPGAVTARKVAPPPVKTKSSLLTFSKGALTTVKGTYKPPTTAAVEKNNTSLENNSTSLENHNTSPWGLPAPDLASMDVDIGNFFGDDFPQDPVPSPPTPPPPPPPPTSEELLNLAGYKSHIAENLPDFDADQDETDLHNDEPVGQPVVQEKRSEPAPIVVQPLPTRSSSMRPTIFGSSAVRPSTPLHEIRRDTATPARPTFSLILDSTVRVPLTLKDINNPTNSNHRLDEVVKASLYGPAGKLYRQTTATVILETLQTGGASARVVIDPKATDVQKAHFERFRLRLQDGELFIAVSGGETLALCSSQCLAIGKKLGVTSTLLGLAGTILISHVVIDNHSAFAVAALEADNVRW